MEEFKIILPSPLLAPYVKNYWMLKTSSRTGALARTVPIGMTSLIFHRGTRLLSVQDNELHPRAFLNGQDSTFADLKYTGQVDMISVVFRPIGIRAFFDLPVNKIGDRRVTAADLSDKELAELENRLTDTGDDRLCILLVERFLLKRLHSMAGHNLERIQTAVRMIDSGQTGISRLAGKACLSTKHFQRLFSEYIGSNPKQFSRIVRFQKALYTLETRPAITLTALAYECGYYDQAHLIKEFKALSGYTPGEYVSVCPPHSDYFS